MIEVVVCMNTYCTICHSILGMNSLMSFVEEWLQNLLLFKPGIKLKYIIFCPLNVSMVTGQTSRS